MHREPAAKTAAEAQFLALGQGARLWLTEAAAAGTARMRVKMAEAVALGKLVGTVEVDWALGHAAVHGRFAEADLASIVDHHASSPAGTGGAAGPVRAASEDHSLTQGTASWASLGAPAPAGGAAPTPPTPPTDGDLTAAAGRGTQVWT